MRKFPFFGILLSAVLLLAVLFSGRLIDNRTFTWTQPHTPIQSDSENSPYLVARNYKQLLDHAQSILLAGEESGNIRFYDSAEDIQADLVRACAELKENTPIGAYAVESIQMTPTRVLSYHHIAVSVTYRRSAEEIASLQPLNTSSELQEILQSALTSARPSLVLSMDYYSPELLNFADALSKVRQFAPDTGYGFSDYEIKTYPNQGLARIVEIIFTYDTTPEESARRKALASDQIDKILALTDAANPMVALRVFRDQIAGSTEWVARSSSADDTPYGVLFNKRGSAFGIAATFYQLCLAADIPCFLVNGTFDGDSHTWNMLYVNNAWYHVDLARECLSPAYYDNFMVPSENMDAYTWTNPTLTH